MDNYRPQCFRCLILLHPEYIKKIFKKQNLLTINPFRSAMKKVYMGAYIDNDLSYTM